MKYPIIIIVVFVLVLTAIYLNKGKQPIPWDSTEKYVVYSNKITQYWPQTALASNMGIPGFAPDTDWNVFIMTFWLSTQISDTALIYSDPLTFFSADNPWGASTTEEIQTAILKAYHDAGKKVLLSAFGATEFPTSNNEKAEDLCPQIADFALKNNFDGVDLDYEDNDAMDAGTAEEWLITCTKLIREKMPKDTYILTHAPQAPYFIGTDHYKNGGYLTVHKEVGDLIDWYNIQFYNQGASTKYDTYDTLFINSGDDSDWPGTAVKQIMDNGIPKEKLVVGKPISPGDATNTGWLSASDFGTFSKQANSEIKWETGIMGWQYSSDTDGSYLSTYISNAKTD